MYDAKVIKASRHPDTDTVLWTMQLEYPRFIHGQVMTHRMFSRNASSSRATPVNTMLKQIKDKGVKPLHWGAKQKGMVADKESSDLLQAPWASAGMWTREYAWERARDYACKIASAYDAAGYHKQLINRLTEPFQTIRVVVSATEWDNFFFLRLADDAQPEIQNLAVEIHRAQSEAEANGQIQTLDKDSPHLPYIFDSEREEFDIATLIQISVARCARVSYYKHDSDSISDPVKDYELFMMLAEDKHWTPFEHVAYPMDTPKYKWFHKIKNHKYEATHTDGEDYWSGNFKHFTQYRQTLEM